jgi:hypothetical protein
MEIQVSKGGIKNLPSTYINYNESMAPGSTAPLSDCVMAREICAIFCRLADCRTEFVVEAGG